MTGSTDILIVDDELEIRGLLKEMTGMRGYTSIDAADGTQALDLLEKHKVNLIICDISMPGINGLEMIAQVRKRGLRSAIVMLTAHSENTMILEALRLGAVDYICKPFDSKELFEKLPHWLEIGRRIGALSEEKDPSISVEKQLRMIELFQMKMRDLSSKNEE